MSCVAPIARAADGDVVVGQRHSLHSRVLGEERAFWVHLPAGYATSTQRYIVLYMTDAETQFAHTATTVDFLARNGRIPPLIVVGVGNTQRTRDLTPRGTWLLGAQENARVPIAGGGGADRFLDFFEQELIPHVEKQWRTERWRLFAGHSFGGLFALHALTTRGHLFESYIAVSPSLAWEGGAPIEALAAAFDAHKEWRKTLVVSAGALEPRRQVGEPFERLRTLLERRAPAGFRWQADNLAGEDHGSQVLHVHEAGLRKVFEQWPAPIDPVSGRPTLETVAQIEAHYRDVSARLGITLAPPEAFVNQRGYGLLGDGKHALALALFELNVRNYPASANVYDSLCDGLEAAGRLAPARDACRQAVERGQASGDANLEVFRQHLRTVEEKLTKPAP
jgi:hypothetical protein